MQPPHEHDLNTTFDPYTNVPACLHDLLIAPTSLTYLDSRQADLNRYALLHRRFTNQILYGCRSSSCNTRTCLSFRKRIATKPVRSYSRPAAQALAAQCIERLANEWRQIADEEERRWKRSGCVPSQRTRALHGTGLCGNDGVVPWYEDGDLWLAERLKTQDTVRGEQDKYDNASLVQFVTCAPQVQAIYELTEAGMSDSDARKQRLPVEERDRTRTETTRTVLRELPPSVLLWLSYESRRRAAVGADGDVRGLRHDAFRRFVVDSITHCLCSPASLIRSASAWAQYAMPVSVFLGLHALDGSEPDTNTHTEAGRRYSQPGGTDDQLPAWTAIRDVCGTIQKLTSPLEGRDLIMRCISKALRQCYTMPYELRRCGPCRNDKSLTTFLSNDEVSRLIYITVGIVAGLFDTVHEDQIATDLELQQSGRIFPRHQFEADGDFDEITDYLENNLWTQTPMVQEYSKMIGDIIAHRIAVDRSLEHSMGRHYGYGLGAPLIERIIHTLRITADEDSPEPLDCYSYIEFRLLKLMRSIMILHWDRQPIIRRTSAVGGAVELMAGLYDYRRESTVYNPAFHQLRFAADALKDIKVLSQWLSFESDPKMMHILEHSFLLKPKRLVGFFRAINLKIMQDSYLKARTLETIANEHMVRSKFPIPSMGYVLDEIRPGMAPHFVMTIRRSNALEDAIGQIWRRDRQELMRPLKVKLGQEDGEEGIDYGGVQQEFFRLIFAEAFDAKYGMFEVYPETYMTWFKPGCPEPVYKFEALGILMALAIYNGVTLPVTMPIVFYRKLLKLKIDKLSHISDGWPELAKSFEILLDWEDGDVADAIGRTYEFSYEHFGRVVSVDMSKTSRLYAIATERAGEHDKKPTGTSTSVTTEAPLINNQTRNAYVKDYIRYLTNDSIESQFQAFFRGFQTILSSKVLSILDPDTLRLLVEGQPYSQPLNVRELEAATTYDEYTPDHQVIQWFWDIVGHEFSEDQKRKLLVFVTASDRVPIGGLKDVRFVIQKDGTGEVGSGSNAVVVLDSHSMQGSEFTHEQEHHDGSESESGLEDEAVGVSNSVHPHDPGQTATESISLLADSRGVQSDHDDSSTSAPANLEPSSNAAETLHEAAKSRAIRLPGSSTCYGRLLLPAYSSKEVLREKLCLAIENSMGFGVL